MFMHLFLTTNTAVQAACLNDSSAVQTVCLNDLSAFLETAVQCTGCQVVVLSPGLYCIHLCNIEYSIVSV